MRLPINSLALILAHNYKLGVFSKKDRAMPDKEKHRKKALECLDVLMSAMSMPENERKEKYGTNSLTLIAGMLADEVNTLANT